jgi:hypothetical protein
MFNIDDYKQFMEWMHKRGKMEHGMTNIYVRDGDKVKTEVKACKILHCTTEDIVEFCKMFGKEYCALLTINF